MSHSAGPSQVIIIRHGEKLGDPSQDASGGPNLSIRGSARAAALPSLFLPAAPELDCALTADTMLKYFGASYNQIKSQGSPPRFAAPDFLFATQASDNSNRPVETITPLSIALQVPINANHPNGDFANVAQDILTNSKYTGKIVLVCWHHSTIPNLATALGIKSPPPWDGYVFDRIWQITYTNGAASPKYLPQMLLYGDSSS